MNTKAKLGFALVATLVVLAGGITALALTYDEQTTTSDATVNNYVAIALSTNLSGGISYGNLDPNTSNNPALHNADNGTGGTSYWLTVSADSNINVDFCIKDNANLTKSGGATIPNVGYTWNDGVSDYSIDTSYVLTNTTNVSAGDKDYFTFLLDIPTSQSAGTYNNTVSFEGIVTGGSCV